MIESPFFSICVPSFNSKKYIADTITSALNQTFKNFELIIVDNNSSDSTIAVIDQFRDDRLKIFKNETNVGVHENHNLCMKYASGKYIQLLSSDDKFLNNSILETIYKQILSCSTEPCVIGLKAISDENYQLVEKINISRPNVIEGNAAIKQIFLNQLPFLLIPSLVIFKKELIYFKKEISVKYVKNNMIAYGDDSEFYLKLIKKSNYLNLDIDSIFYRIHSESLTEVSTASGEALKLHCDMLNRWIRKESIIKLNLIEKLWIMSTDYLRITNELPDDNDRRETLKYEFTIAEKFFVIFRKFIRSFIPQKIKATIKSIIFKN